jgi:hypothetical protein
LDRVTDNVGLLVVSLWRDPDGVKARVTATFDVRRSPSVTGVAGVEALRARVELWLAEAVERLGSDDQPRGSATNL